MKKSKSIVKKKPAANKTAKASAKAAPKKASAGATSASGGSAKKPVAKPVVKKTAAKAAPKPAPKKAVAATQFPRAESRGASPKKTAVKETKAAEKAPKVAKVEVKKAAPAVKAVAKEAKPAANETATKAPKAPKATKAAKEKGDAKAKEAAPADAFPALDGNVKRPSKPFFLEVKPGVERVIKRGDKSAISQVIDLQARRKGPAAEETSDELAERIERELQSQSFLKRAPMRPQLCTKCGINAVTPRFTIDRELGYCEGCAEILHLGETKEARRMESSLAVKKEEIAPPGPDEIAAEDTDEEPVPEDLEE